MVESRHFQDCDSLYVSWQFFNHKSVRLGLQPTSQYQPILCIQLYFPKEKEELLAQVANTCLYLFDTVVALLPGFVFTQPKTYFFKDH